MAGDSRMNEWKKNEVRKVFYKSNGERTVVSDRSAVLTVLERRRARAVHLSDRLESRTLQQWQLSHQLQSATRTGRRHQSRGTKFCKVGTAHFLVSVNYHSSILLAKEFSSLPFKKNYERERDVGREKAEEKVQLKKKLIITLSDLLIMWSILFWILRAVGTTTKRKGRLPMEQEYK